MKKVKLNTAQMGVPAGQELEVVDRHTASLTLRTGDGRQIVVPHSAVDEIEEEFVPDYKSVLSREDSSPGDKKVDMFEEGFAAAKKLHDSAIEESAKKIYEGWSEHPEYVPWQDGGNSDKQEEARQIAREKSSQSQVVKAFPQAPEGMTVEEVKEAIAQQKKEYDELRQNQRDTISKGIAEYETRASELQGKKDTTPVNDVVTDVVTPEAPEPEKPTKRTPKKKK